MAWSNQEIRKLLSLMSKAQALEKFPLAVQLKEALGAATARDAMFQVIERTFDVRTPLNEALRQAIMLCDVQGNKSLSAAATMGVSARTLFRWRSAAITAIATTVDQLLQGSDSQSQFKYVMARMIAPVESATATQLLEREASNIGSRAAYEAVCTALRNGREISQELVKKCTGHWGMLAELEIARTNLVRGKPHDYETMRASIRAALDSVEGVSFERVKYELAYTDRLNALRLCDVDATGEATGRMTGNAGADPALVTFALVCEAEQACDEGDLGRADTLVRRLQLLCTRMKDFRTTARTSHVAAILQFLRGRYSDAIELANATTAALKQVEPEFATCSAGNAGRASLFAGQSWKRPLELCVRFPRSYVTGYVDAVWARHLAYSDPELALTVIERAISVLARQEAWGVLVYAQATKAILLDVLGDCPQAEQLRITAWETAVRLRRVFYLYDLFVHPSAPQRALGIFDLDDHLRSAAVRRVIELSNGLLSKDDGETWLDESMALCLDAAQQNVVALPSAGRHFLASRETPCALACFGPEDLAAIRRCLVQLATELSYCAAPPQRAAFLERFVAAVSNLMANDPRQRVPSSLAN